MGSSLLLAFVVGLAILDTERSITGSQIANLGDGIWWSFVTITTVGYGEIYPATALGRVIGNSRSHGAWRRFRHPFKAITSHLS